MPLHESSSTLGSTTNNCHISCTRSYTGSRFLSESVLQVHPDVCLARQGTGVLVCDYCHQSLKSLLHCTLPADCSKTSPQRVWLSGTLSRWPDDFQTNLPYKLDNPRVNAATYP